MQNAKHTISKFLHSSMLEWDDILPFAAYIYNISPNVNDFKLPFFLVFSRDPLEGRLSLLQNYCRYLRTQVGELALDKLRRPKILRRKESSIKPQI